MDGLGAGYVGVNSEIILLVVGITVEIFSSARKSTDFMFFCVVMKEANARVGCLLPSTHFMTNHGSPIVAMLFSACTQKDARWRRATEPDRSERASFWLPREKYAGCSAIAGCAGTPTYASPVAYFHVFSYGG